MAENSKIEWTDHTFNPWTGCTAVSPACDHCYAEGWAKRSGHVQWGPHGERRRTSVANWRLPLKWDAQAKAEGRRARVFCASLADVFDNHRSIEDEWRQDLWRLIHRTPNLDWLLLTKRPGNIRRYLPDYGDVQPNIWLGTTVENQAEADRRIPHLLAVPAKVHFLSCEPLLGPVDISWAMGHPYRIAGGFLQRGHFSPGAESLRPLDWVICGGESGPGARPMHPDWARSLRDQCQAAGVAFHFKQWGEWAPGEAFGMTSDAPVTDKRGQVKDWMDRYVMTDTWGQRLQGHSFTKHATDLVYRVGKKAAGRLLDGREWNEVPHG